MLEIRAEYPVLIFPTFEPGQDLVNVVASICKKAAPHIIVVNDGSSSQARDIYREIQKFPTVHVLHHTVNRGKGASIKTAIRYYLDHFPKSNFGIVTADPDGQHDAHDIQKMLNALFARPGTLHLGRRHYSDAIPLKKLIGNWLTSKLFLWMARQRIRDTQTSLRAIPRQYLLDCLNLPGEHYEYELNMIIHAVKKRWCINEIPIDATYFDHPLKPAHNHLFLDSARIYLSLISWPFRG